MNRSLLRLLEDEKQYLWDKKYAENQVQKYQGFLAASEIEDVTRRIFEDELKIYSEDLRKANDKLAETRQDIKAYFQELALL